MLLNRYLLAFLAFICLSTPVVTVTVLPDNPVQKLAAVKKIFIAPFGTGEGVEVIRDKVINRLLKSDLVVVDSADEADAVLSGSAQTNSRFRIYVSGGYGGANTRYSVELVVRLTGKKHEILWTNEVKSDWLHHHSSAGATSNVADKLVADLCKAIAKDQVSIATKEDKHS